MLSWGVLVAICMLLLLGLAGQFLRYRKRGLLFDSLALLPQWKFFALVRVDSDKGAFDDFHIIARVAAADGTPGAWQPIFSPEQRTLINALWHPAMRSKSAILEAAMQIAYANAADKEVPPTALAYLTILRLCHGRLPANGHGRLQFAIATTHGSLDRPVALAFLSGWHVQ